MENEFRIQVRAELRMMANIVIGLRKRGETKAFRSLNTLAQEALRIAEEVLLQEITEQEEVTDLEDAISVLEETELFNFGSSSVNERSLFRGRRARSINEAHEEGARNIVRGTRNRAWGKTNAAGESEAEATIRMAAEAEIRRLESERKRMERENLPKITPEQLAYMNTPRMDLPGLMPRDRSNEAPDMSDEETQEQKLERFKQRDSERLEK